MRYTLTKDKREQLFTMQPMDYLIAAAGTWDSATLKLQINPFPNLSPEVWFDYQSISFTSNGYMIAQGFNVTAKLILVGGTNPSITVALANCQH